MKVEYADICKELERVIHSAIECNRTIRFIKLTKVEYYSLQKSMFNYRVEGYNSTGELGAYDNVKIVGIDYKEENE